MKKLLVSVVFIALFGIGGLFIFRDSPRNRVVSKDAQQATGGSASVKNDPSEDGKYLVIKEWGVRFPIPDESIDLATTN